MRSRTRVTSSDGQFLGEQGTAHYRGPHGFHIALWTLAAIFAVAGLSSCAGYTNASNATRPTNPPGVGSLSTGSSSLSFGTVLIGSHTALTLGVTNTGNATVHVTQVAVSGAAFSMTGGNAPASIAVGQSASLQIQFAPQAAGAASGTLTIQSDASDPNVTIPLSGTGVATQAQMTARPSPVAFNGVNVGGSATQNVTLTNNGNATLDITAASVTGLGYSMSLRPTSINAGASGAFSVTFAPTASGNAAGSISITSNAPGSPATIALSGIGLQAQGSTRPASASFGNVVVGSSNSQPIALMNNGNATLTFSQVLVSGAGFSITGLSTATTIAAGASVSFNAVFSPTTAAPSSGSITLATNGSPAQLNIGLSGTGVAATQLLGTSSASESFGNVNVGSSRSLTSTLTNTGNTDVSISGVTVSGTGFSAGGVSAGLILTPNQAATLTMTFSPAGLGNDTGSVSVASNATNSPVAISLSGESHTVSLSWTASTSTGVTGYYVYRGTTSGQYAKLNASAPATSTTYTDTTIQAATTYYYVVTAVNSSNVESVYSSPPATASIP